MKSLSGCNLNKVYEIVVCRVVLGPAQHFPHLDEKDLLHYG